ncbi:MAG: iron-siderophore ABC transporter substrate-binding protein [Nostoc sp. LLA-1]|nr:iron-siderophore ABC transporter substrate-binding protein [Cyanocohniella sp. LLY]
MGLLLITACTPKDRQNIQIPIESGIAECHSFQHVMGETCIPTAPKRIITLSAPTLNNALLLGVKPLGSTYFADDHKLLISNGIEYLGLSQPNLEKISLLKPDLILGWENIDKSVYPLLSKIAPTVLGKWEGPLDWSKHFDFVAQVLGKEKEAKEAWKNYYKKIETLKIALGIDTDSLKKNGYQGQKISFIHTYFGNRGVESHVKNSFVGSILDTVGLQRPTAQNINAPYGIISISEEELEKADGDVLFVSILRNNAKEAFARIQKRPLWKRLNAVQKNHVYLVDPTAWYGASLTAANAVLDDLYKYLLNTP